MENYVIYDELVNRCSTIEGGVNNVQGTLDDELVNRCSTIEGGVNNVQGTLDASNLISADSVVKSVQRGIAQGAGNNNHTTVNIEISTVNAEKCAVLVNAITTAATNTGSPNVAVRELQSRRLVLDISYPDFGVRYITYSWQVIEFY